MSNRPIWGFYALALAVGAAGAVWGSTIASSTWKAVAAVGLLWDVMGVVVLARGFLAVPTDWLTTRRGLDYYCGGPEAAIDQNAELLAEWLEQNRREARPGLVLIGLGFMAQFVATVLG